MDEFSGEIPRGGGICEGILGVTFGGIPEKKNSGRIVAGILEIRNKNDLSRYII